jgi:hypothetical protein
MYVEWWSMLDNVFLHVCNWFATLFRILGQGDHDDHDAHASKQIIQYLKYFHASNKMIHHMGKNEMDLVFVFVNSHPQSWPSLPCSAWKSGPVPVFHLNWLQPELNQLFYFELSSEPQPEPGQTSPVRFWLVLGLVTISPRPNFGPGQSSPGQD